MDINDKQKSPNNIEKYYTSCMRCGKQLDGERFKSFFCSKECYRRLISELSEMMQSIGAKIPEAWLRE